MFYLGAEALTPIAELVFHRSGPAQRLTAIREYAFSSRDSTASAAVFVGSALPNPT